MTVTDLIRTYDDVIIGNGPIAVLTAFSSGSFYIPLPEDKQKSAYFEHHEDLPFPVKALEERLHFLLAISGLMPVCTFALDTEIQDDGTLLIRTSKKHPVTIGADNIREIYPLLDQKIMIDEYRAKSGAEHNLNSFTIDNESWKHLVTFYESERFKKCRGELKDNLYRDIRIITELGEYDSEQDNVSGHLSPAYIRLRIEAELKERKVLGRFKEYRPDGSSVYRPIRIQHTKREIKYTVPNLWERMKEIIDSIDYEQLRIKRPLLVKYVDTFAPRGKLFLP